MKLTKIKRFNKKLSSQELRGLANAITSKLGELGFITEFTILNGQTIKLGINKKSFIIDTDRLGYNTSVTPYGMKRTNIPSWDQRVIYNDTINDILDSMSITCNIRNSVFKIRSEKGRFNEEYWCKKRPEYMEYNIRMGYYISEIDYKDKTVVDRMSKIVSSSDPLYLLRVNELLNTF